MLFIISGLKKFLDFYTKLNFVSCVYVYVKHLVNLYYLVNSPNT